MMTLYPILSARRRLQVRIAIQTWRARPGKGIRNRAKTACPQGHPYDVTFTLKKLSRTGRPQHGRRCDQCHKTYMRTYYLEKLRPRNRLKIALSQSGELASESPA
jgi:hypothetical protein